MKHRTSRIGGVLALVAAIAGSACARDDGDGVTDAVRAALRASPDVDDRDIAVRVDGRAVVLDGEVETLLAKQEAVAVARTVPEVTTVVDRIAVERYERPDDVIERRVAQALMVDPDSELTVGVDVFHGVVRLRGFVDQPSDIVTARRIAASVRGVTGVVDDLRTRPLAARALPRTEP